MQMSVCRSVGGTSVSLTHSFRHLFKKINFLSFSNIAENMLGKTV